MLELYIYAGFATTFAGWLVSEGFGPNEHPWWVYAVVGVIWPWALIWVFVEWLRLVLKSNS